MRHTRRHATPFRSRPRRVVQTPARRWPRSIRNWAYVKGIGGRYNDGINLVDSAITVRGRLGRRHEQAISYSVKGDVYRYQRQFKDAWEAYAEAEQLFGDTSPSWLGRYLPEAGNLPLPVY